MKDLMTSVPGIDEAMAFAELMKMVQEMNYSTIGDANTKTKSFTPAKKNVLFVMNSFRYCPHWTYTSSSFLPKDYGKRHR